MISPTAVFPTGLLHVAMIHLLTFSVQLSDPRTGGGTVLLNTTDIDMVFNVGLDGVAVGYPVDMVLTFGIDGLRVAYPAKWLLSFSFDVLSGEVCTYSEDHPDGVWLTEDNLCELEWNDEDLFEALQLTHEELDSNFEAEVWEIVVGENEETIFDDFIQL